MSFRTATAAASLVLLASPVRANDQSAGVAPLPLRLQPTGGGVLTATGIVLDGDQVRLTLTVNLKQDAAIRFELPRFEWLGEGEPYPDRHFPELKVEVDGQPISPVDDSVATVQSKDVMPLLREAGVDPFAIADTPPLVEAVPGRRAALDRLIEVGAVRRAPEGMLAAWNAARRLRVMPGTGAHAVTFRYTARPAFALTTVAAAEVRWQDYCTTAAGATRALARKRLGGAIVVKRHAIPASLDGIRPRMLTLRVTPRAGAATIVCGAGGKALFDPAGKVAVRAGPDGMVRMLQIVKPG